MKKGEDHTGPFRTSLHLQLTFNHKKIRGGQKIEMGGHGLGSKILYETTVENVDFLKGNLVQEFLR